MVTVDSTWAGSYFLNSCYRIVVLPIAPPPLSCGPAVDMDKVQEIHDKANLDTILNSPEIMFYIDQDKEMSEAFRQGLALTSTWRSLQDDHFKLP